MHWTSPVGLTWIASVACGLACTGLGFYCFNILAKKSIDVKASGARVDVLMQRRNDLSRNLENAIVAERRHETAVFEDVSHTRFPKQALPTEPTLPTQLAPAPSNLAPSPGAPPQLPSALAAPSLLSGLSLDKLLAIVEQYPQVRLSENMQSLIQAFVEVERDIGESRKKLVDAMNVYEHEIHTFPSKFFAGIFGFRDVQFFQAGPEAGHLVPVQF
jgi:LemA protein